MESVSMRRDHCGVVRRVVVPFCFGATAAEMQIHAVKCTGHSHDFIEEHKSGMAVSQMNISQSNLQNTPIPIPPLAEQQRIVAKVDELMRLCDRLEAQLKRMGETRQKVLDATLNQVLTTRGLAVETV